MRCQLKDKQGAISDLQKSTDIYQNSVRVERGKNDAERSLTLAKNLTADFQKYSSSCVIQ